MYVSSLSLFCCRVCSLPSVITYWESVDLLALLCGSLAERSSGAFMFKRCRYISVTVWCLNSHFLTL